MAEHISSRVRTIRLPNELWDRIESDAADLGMSPNAYVRRRLAASFSRVPENRKVSEIESEMEPLPA